MELDRLELHEMLMAETSEVINVLERCHVAPPTAIAAELSLPLTFYDLQWLNFHPIQRLLFYQFPHPKLHFIETIIPKLKESLSLTLKHFLPLAGNLICPLDSGMPELRYAMGDTVSVTFAESFEDFQDLVGDHARNAPRFHSLIPRLPPAASVASSTQVTALFALQVTVFPNYGIAIGSAHQHVIGDANVVIGFMRAWASINKFDGEAKLLDNGHKFLPFYGREVIKDPYKLGTLFFDQMTKAKPWPSASDVAMVPTKNIRATYVMSQAEIQKLKKFVLAKMPTLVHGSSFVITCAYIWTCLLKSLDATGDEKVDENEAEYFGCVADCRARLDPPLPANYFGNCVVPCLAKSTHGEIAGPEGLLIASEKIGMSIHKRVHDQEGILKGVWFYELQGINLQRVLSVSGSTKHDTYDADFGWGRPEKYECISIDINGAISVNKSRKYEGGLEVGLSLPKYKMDSFATIFTAGLRSL